MLLPNPRLRPPGDVNLAGEIPSPVNLPQGCFLASRCPFVIDACKARVPPAEQVGDGHLVHCIRHEEVAKTVPAGDLFDRFQAETERILSVGAPIRG